MANAFPAAGPHFRTLFSDRDQIDVLEVLRPPAENYNVTVKMGSGGRGVNRTSIVLSDTEGGTPRMVVKRFQYLGTWAPEVSQWISVGKRL